MTSPADVMLPPQGTRVLVTGACGGLGRSLCGLLVDSGCVVAGVDAVAPDTNSFPGRELVLADVADPEAASRAVDRVVTALDGLDVVVGAAAIVDTVRRAATFPTELWRRDLDTNLSGQFYVLQAAHPALVNSPDPRVVLVSSIAGLDGVPGQAAYAASKGGVIAVARTLAGEWAEDAIKVNTIVPGVFRTEKVDAMPPSTANRMRARIPLGRFGDPVELAGFILFLLSPAGAYCNGAIYRVDGGMSLFTEGFFK